MGKLGAHLFRAMDKRDARLPDTEMAAGMDGIPNHLYALLQGRPGDDSGIREEQQFIIGGNLHDGQMRQYPAFGQQPFLLVENDTEQIIRIDDTFHQNIRTALAHDADSLSRRLVFIFDMQCLHVFGIFLQSRVFLQDSRIANHQKLRNAFIQSAGDSIFSIGVIGTNYGNALPFI